MTLDNGVERGIRMLEFRTGSGLRFTVLVDRAMDIAEVEHAGQAIGWHSPTGFRHPGLHEVESEDGISWARSFSGFLLTCGLDHTLAPEEVPADSYNYPRRATVQQPLHGRVGMIPARLAGYGEQWIDDRCILWAEGIVQQATMFGEDLHMMRRIEADVGGMEIRLTDRVVNHGFLPTPHMFFYHINLGYPLLDEGARYLAPIKDVVWASHADESYRAQAVGYNQVPQPMAGFSEQVWQHEMAADEAGQVHVALVNDRLNLGLEVTTQKDQLPCCFQWQNFQSGNYAMAIEPSSHHVLGNLAARDRGEMIWLAHDQSRSHEAKFTVLTDAGQISACEQKIHSAAKQPSEPYPPTSGEFVPLRDSMRSQQPTADQ